MSIRVNTGGLKVMEYKKGYKSSKLSKKKAEKIKWLFSKAFN